MVKKVILTVVIVILLSVIVFLSYKLYQPKQESINQQELVYQQQIDSLLEIRLVTDTIYTNIEQIKYKYEEICTIILDADVADNLCYFESYIDEWRRNNE